MNSATIVQKLWNYCNVLRDDGMSYGDYVEQLTYLLFLKMADERSKPPFNLAGESPSPILKDYDWPSLLAKDGDELFDHYRHTLEKLGAEKGTIGLIFAKALNKFQDPAKLRRLVVDLIDGENWSAMGADVKGDAYEGLLEKNAQDTKSGAGQYFTPRPLIQAMVDCIAPKSGETVCDPACGTGGFLFAAHNHVAEHNPNLTREQKKHLKEKAFVGYELVQSTARLAAMNMMLHGIGSDKSVPIVVADALAADPGERFDVVLANPPFGKKSSTMITGAEGKVTTEKDVIERDDFWATTSNKQLNFVQHIKTLLKQHGRAAVVLPDNVLFEGGAGETIRKKLLHECDVHTILRLPTGLFYAQGVKANVVFFERKPASETPWTKKLWIYDLRTNQHFTLKTNPLRREHLDEFVKLYNPANRHDRKATWSVEPSTGSGRTGDGSGRAGDGSGRAGDGSGRTGDGSGRTGDGSGRAGDGSGRAGDGSGRAGDGSGRTGDDTGQEGRWRAYDYADLIARDKASLDIFWLKDDSLADSDNLPPPDVIAQEIVDDLEAALEQFRLIAGDLTGDLTAEPSP